MIFWALLVATATPPAESVRLNPIVVEAASETSAPTIDEGHLRPPVVQPAAGFGAKVIDAPLNELGVEQKNMERLEELSLERSEVARWLLTPGVTHYTQLQLDLSSSLAHEQRGKARWAGKGLGFDLRFEASGYRDHGPVTYLDNHGTSYDRTDDTQAERANRREGAYAKVGIGQGIWRALIDADLRSEDVYVSTRLLGAKARQQGGVSIQGSWAEFQATPYLQWRNDSFDATDIGVSNTLYSNSTTGVRLGVQSTTPFSITKNFEFALKTDLSRESLLRDFSANDSSVHFERWYGSGKLYGKWQTHPWVEVSSHLATELMRDQVPTHSETQALWDAGIEVSSTRRYYGGVLAKLRRYSITPTPSQRFGDGVLLQGSPLLPAETGVRAAAGPWWSDERNELALSLFAEQAKNTAIHMRISPTSASTRPLGGVWTRGLEANGKLRRGPYELQFTYILQDAVDASEINWYRGRAVPNRPDWQLQTQLEYDRGFFRLGASHRFRSTQAIDPGALWSLPSAHQMDAFIAYGRPSWEIRLAANHLLGQSVDPVSADFRDGDVANFLEPALPRRELRVIFEWVL